MVALGELAIGGPDRVFRVVSLHAENLVRVFHVGQRLPLLLAVWQGLL